MLNTLGESEVHLHSA